MRAKIHSEISTVGVVIRKTNSEQVRDVIYSQLFWYEEREKKNL
jgi:hypothetical protein